METNKNEKTGKGAFSVVYKATHLIDRGEYAIKKMNRKVPQAARILTAARNSGKVKAEKKQGGQRARHSIGAVSELRKSGSSQVRSAFNETTLKNAKHSGKVIRKAMVDFRRISLRRPPGPLEPLA